MEQCFNIFTISVVPHKRCTAATRVQETVTAKVCPVINVCMAFRLAHFYNLSGTDIGG